MNFLSKTIPVFLHIPKIAGTFIISTLMVVFRYYGMIQKWNDEHGWNVRLRRIHVETNNKTVLILFAYDKDDVRLTHSYLNQSKDDPYVTTISLEDFYDNFKIMSMNLFAVIIESDGVSLLREKLIPLLTDLAAPGVNYQYFSLLRNPLYKAYSMFKYITSENSKHESTHKAFKSSSFEEYITSYEVEDSWFIRTFLNLHPNHIITDIDFNTARMFLNNFRIADISKAFQLLDDVVFACYNIRLYNIPKQFLVDLNKNSTERFKDGIVIKDINSVVKFTIRTHYDYRLYQHFIGHC